DIDVDELQRRVRVDAGSRTDTLTVSATAGTPERAQAISAAVAAAYVEHRQNSAVDTIQRALDEIDDRLAELSRRANSAGSELERQAAYAEYQRFYTHREELTVQSALRRGGAEIIPQTADATAPGGPRPLTRAGVGVGLGLL